MAIDVKDIAERMVAAARGSFANKWPDVSSYAEEELGKIARDIAYIEAQFLLGKMTQEQARLQLHLQANASKIVLLAVKGMTILVVEAAINAALNVVKEAVNTALRFELL